LQDAQQSEGQPSGQEVSIPDAQQEISVPQEEVSVPQEEVSVPEISQPEVSIPAESTVP
jgi:hypothetical protein